MRKAYLLAYGNGIGTQEQVKNWVDKMNSVILWRYDMSNAFYLISEDSAEIIAKEFREYANKGIFIVTELEANSYGWLVPASWHLINHKEYQVK